MTHRNERCDVAIKDYYDPKQSEGYSKLRRGDYGGALRDLANINYVPPTNSGDTPTEGRSAPRPVDQDAVEEKRALMELVGRSDVDVLTRASLIARIGAVEEASADASTRLAQLRKHIERLLGWA